MEKASCKSSPQVGTRKGESHPSATAEGCPSYSGGGNNCLVGRQSADLRKHDICLPILDSELLSEKEKIPAVEATRRKTRQSRGGAIAPPTPAVSSDADDLSDCSLMSGVSVQSTATSVSARKRALPAYNSEGERPKKKTVKPQVNKDDGFLEPLTPIAKTRAKASLPSAEELRREMNEQPTDDLGSRIIENLEIIEKVADKSRNIKGDMVQAIRLAVRQIQAAATEVVQRAATAHLEKENETLRSQLTSLSDKVETLTAELEEMRRRNGPGGPQTRSQTNRAGNEEDALMHKIGSVIDRKLASFRDELFPGRAVRPLLGQKPSRAAPVPQRLATAPVGLPVASTSPERVGDSEATWSKVVGRKARAKMRRPPQMEATRRQSPSRGRGKSAPQRRPAALPTKTPEPARSGKKKKAKREKLPRLPKSAAVTVTVPEGSNTTYAQVMSTAKSQINLPDLGIAGVRQKRALNGGLLLEVAGEGCTEKADALARKLQEAVAEMGAKVARPSKLGEARVMDLDDSVTQQDVASAIAVMCGCVASDIKVGEIRRRASALGTAWVRCPLTAVRKLASAKRVLVGWVSARVEVLPARQLQCFRCLETGHARHQCTSATDRSALCYACGEPNHKASQCVAPVPRCALCADLGRPADHRLGSRNCKPPKRKTRGNGGIEQAATVASSTRVNGPAHNSASSHCPPEEVMDT
ncbi:uncharacterized protein [Epargyreus clarus]|uniref:uncharacterized protein n=1 Tax=Epargyreus clarus TaxID=520877 RepID=UPI003C2E6B35